ncbi:MAG: triacylglycerol lipase [Rhodococcus sp.]|uniref:lipase family protein n=1 Tax=Rhodococcus sp. TaxID=1831 RepID=UPI0016AC9787|nr:lipase family protein [Rhodococcus sp. (in: high G+C Gram-positive bacteria)]NLV79706.1 triacylglycerol lipase [Rhodococcus sp. (in: high G+C Gram-positive bacteria)]
MRRSTPGVSVRVLLTAVVSTVCALVGAGPASASPVSGIPLPPPVTLDGILPTPITDDPFFDRPGDLAAHPVGAVLRERPTRMRALPASVVPHTAQQFMVRSTDSTGRPIPVTATLVLPRTPWHGGPRPVVVYNMAIDSLGARCTPSYRMVHEAVDIDVPPMLPILLARGWAVLVPDHQGPHMAYAAGPLAGHAVLDSVRGMRSVAPELAESPLAMTGYSGGAIATGWAAQLQPTYAPDVQFTGAAAGGLPADLALLRTTLNGQLGSGLFLAATMGLAREYPQLLVLANPLVAVAAASPLKDQCTIVLAAAGAAMIPVESFTTVPDPFDEPVVRQVLDANRLGGQIPQAPMYLYHGSSQVFLGDEFIPESGVIAVQQKWCAGGANVTYVPVWGEHLTAAVAGAPGMMEWIADRLAGIPATQGCP